MIHWKVSWSTHSPCLSQDCICVFHTLVLLHFDCFHEKHLLPWDHIDWSLCWRCRCRRKWLLSVSTHSFRSLVRYQRLWKKWRTLTTSWVHKNSKLESRMQSWALPSKRIPWKWRLVLLWEVDDSIGSSWVGCLQDSESSMAPSMKWLDWASHLKTFSWRRGWRRSVFGCRCSWSRSWSWKKSLLKDPLDETMLLLLWRTRGRVWRVDPKSFSVTWSHHSLDCKRTWYSTRDSLCLMSRHSWPSIREQVLRLQTWLTWEGKRNRNLCCLSWKDTWLLLWSRRSNPKRIPLTSPWKSHQHESH